MATSTSTSTRSKITRGKPRGNSAGSSRKSSGNTASSMVLQLVSGAMGDSLSDVVSNLKTKVADQVTVHGEEYLDAAKEHIADATAKVVEWGKKHPVKTVAAAAALIAVSGFLYATLNGKTGTGRAAKGSGR